MIYPTITDISNKGQVLIPSGLRKSFGFLPRGKVIILPNLHDQTLTLKPIKDVDIVTAGHGLLASPDGKTWTKDLLADRKTDQLQE